MGILGRAKRILKSHVNSAFDDAKVGRSGEAFDPLADGAATMDDEEWYRAAKAREAGKKRQHHRAPATPVDEISRAYANLDCLPGADLKTVREAWRKKMLKYHPDRFPDDPKKRETATRLTALLNESFQKLETYLKLRGGGN